jgi:pyruvate formate lyase activating enzyme
MKSGIVFDIKKFAVHDGPGIRTSVFLKGCPLKCIWCHNPESRAPECIKTPGHTRIGNLRFTDEKSIGKEMSADEVINEVLKDKIFYEESGGGITFSGGEPFYQLEFLKELLHNAKENNLHTTVDTSGYVNRAYLEKTISDIDLFLYDIKLIDNTVHKKFTGVSNDLILDNLRFLLEQNANVIIRIPIISGITDTVENISGIIQMLQQLNFTGNMNLLPYHKTAMHKYDLLKMNNKLEEMDNCHKDLADDTATRFAEAGFSVSVGG